MDSIIIYPVCGLYRELYYPSPELLNSPRTITSINNSNYLDANSLFWVDALSNKTVNSVVKSALALYSDFDGVPIRFRAVAADPKSFVVRVMDAKEKVADQGVNPRQFFSYLETLNIYCALYANVSEKYKMPFTIQEGWMLGEESSEKLFNTCLDSTQNPYLDFIKMTVLPIIERANPKVAFLAGRPGYFSFALARLLKQRFQSIFICVTRHSSEYYSLNKIDYLLIQNAELFKTFDGVILEHFEETEKSVVAAVSQQQNLHSVNNLVYSYRSEIKQTCYHVSKHITSFPKVEKRPATTINLIIPPCYVANIHLFPYVKCYWNQCNFCGINKKYHFENPAKAYYYLDRQLENMKEQIDGVSHVWFIDEALPPDTLKNIAIFFIRNMNGITWQARCRIEPDLVLDDIPAVLAESGLRELRLGLESGSPSILKKMNKFDDSFSFELVEEICKKYTACGISIHFPIIIGFPGESDADRRMTYELLRNLMGKYAGVTFNINLFGLDIGSKVYRQWQKFEIKSIDFPCDPTHFIGNILRWHNDQSNEQLLAIERDQFMREQLYPWMPTHALTPPHIFYRLSETIRNTLIWKEHTLWPEQDNLPPMPIKAQTSDLSVVYDCKQDNYYIYSWLSHHYMLGNQALVDLLQAFDTPHQITDALVQFCKRTSCKTSINELETLIRRLLCDQYLLPSN